MTGHADAHRPGTAAWQACPSCRLPMPAERAVCKTCGSLVPVENLARYGRVQAADLVRRASDALLRDRPERLLWVLAAIPLFLLPPALVLGLVFLRWSSLQALPGGRRTLAAVTALALVNIVASAILLTAVSDSLVALAAGLWHGLFAWQPAPPNGRNLHYL